MKIHWKMSKICMKTYPVIKPRVKWVNSIDVIVPEPHARF
jgi:hypothetical protein